MCRGCALGIWLLLAIPLAFTEPCAQADATQISLRQSQASSPPFQSPPAQAPTEENPGNTKAPPAPQSATAAPSVPHTISVKFDYDFDQTPACSSKITHKCVNQFVIYDISGGPDKPFRIGTVPVPDNPTGKKQGITGKSDPRIFEPGRHLIAVTAEEAEPASPAGGSQSKPLESPVAACTTWVTIP